MRNLWKTLMVAVVFLGTIAVHDRFESTSTEMQAIEQMFQGRYVEVVGRLDTQARTLGVIIDFTKDTAAILGETRNELAELSRGFDLSVLETCGIITDGFGHGSCVAIGEDLVLTAGHCLGHEGSWIEISSRKYEIVEEWASDKYDVGFVRVKGKLPFVKLGLKPEVLEEIYVVGAPTSPEFVTNISKGIVTKLGLDWWEYKIALVVDAANYFGNSGGPVFDKDGKVIGILVAGPDRTDSIGVCVPVWQIRSALRAYLGDK